MNISCFESIAKALSSFTSKTYTYEGISELLSAIESQQIRDFDTFCSGHYGLGKCCSCVSLNKSCIYTIGLGLLKCLSFEFETSQKLSIWKSIYALSDVPEFDNSIFLNTLNEELCEQVVSELFVGGGHILLNQKQHVANENSDLRDACLLHTKHYVHYIYKYRVDLRAPIRKMLGEAAMDGLKFLQDHDPFKGQYGSGSLVNLQGKRICIILEIVAAIVDGMYVNENTGVYELLLVEMGMSQVESLWGVLYNLMVDMLLPLHTPNEMDEWRDQLPVIQVYHQTLCLCLCKVILAERRLYAMDALRKTVSSSNVPLTTAGATQLKTPGFVLGLGAIEEEFESLGAANVVPKNNFPQLRMVDRPSLLVSSMLLLFKMWPEGYTANTPKEVLMLHEVEMLVCLASEDEFTRILPALMERLRGCIDHDNTRPIQRALQFFKSERVLCLFKPHMDYINAQLLPCLFRRGELFWNPTVNKLTGLTLKNMEKLDPISFRNAANNVCKCSDARMNRKESPQLLKLEAQPPKLTEPESMYKKVRSAAAPKVLGASGMALPKPVGFNPATKMPPLSVSRCGQMETPANPLATKGLPVPINGTASCGAAGLMPAEITGVAPWATKRSLSSFDGAKTDSCKADEKGSVSGYEQLLKYMEKCNPPSKDQEEVSAWNDKQAAATPTLLPSLKFHDLVFGKELGSGAFSIVKYCRQIVREKSGSLWPEFAVKIVSLQQGSDIRGHKGEEKKCSYLDLKDHAAGVVEEGGFDYTASVAREIAVLQVLSHPSISRLISCFKYTGSVYMVLEYAGRGDLHTYLVSNSALRSGYGNSICGLPLLHTRFILGEVLSALYYIHSQGFVYCDLKPENVLITALGHVKLTDFGACRPTNYDAQQTLQQSCKLLSQLRDGDWRAKQTADCKNAGIKSTPVAESIEEFSEFAESTILEDSMAEGTLSYLPPEVLNDMGKNRPDAQSDSWSLGCVAYFCIVGKPLFFGSTVDDIVFQHEKLGLTNMVHANFSTNVRFAGNENFSSGSRIFVDSVRSAIGNDQAVTFTECLLKFSRQSRMSIAKAIVHPFITGSNEKDLVDLEPLKLHFQTPPIVTLPVIEQNAFDSTSIREDDGWSRRQFSRIWAPMPVNYSISNDSDGGMSQVDTLNNTNIENRNMNNLERTIPSLIETYGRMKKIVLGVLIESIGEAGAAFCTGNFW